VKVCSHCGQLVRTTRAGYLAHHCLGVHTCPVAQTSDWIRDEPADEPAGGDDVREATKKRRRGAGSSVPGVLGAD
jgi:hypothetical protein